MEKITKYIKKLLPVLLVAVIITTYFSLNIVAYYVNTASGSDTAYPAKFDFTVAISAETEAATIDDARNVSLPATYTNVYVVTITNKGEVTGEAKVNTLTLSKAVPVGVTVKSVGGAVLATQGATSVDLSGTDSFTTIAPGTNKQFKFHIVSETNNIKFNYQPKITANVTAQQVN